MSSAAIVTGVKIGYLEPWRDLAGSLSSTIISSEEHIPVMPVWQGREATLTLRALSKFAADVLILILLIFNSK